MARLTHDLAELDAIPPDLVWKLVDTLFGQTTSMLVGGAVCALLGIVGLVGTGSLWYLIGLVYTVSTCAWRVWQARRYASSRDDVTPVAWVWRSVRSGWAAALGWGAWSTVALFEHEKSMVILVIGMHAGLVVGGAVRNCAVRVVAEGQIILASVPLFVACLASGNPYLVVYAGIDALHLFAALELTRHLNRQTVQLLLKQKEASGLVARLEAANQELALSNQHLEALVGIDALTGASNRRAFDITVSREWGRAMREQVPLSLLLVDVDHFKAFNDLYGHQAGDACLRDIVAAIQSAIRRPGDTLARYGGEEFGVILPQTELDGALHVARRILDAVVLRALAHDGSGFGQVTVSIGVACLIPTPHSKVDGLIGLADAALYLAKRDGRNGVRASEVVLAAQAEASIRAECGRKEGQVPTLDRAPIAQV